MTSGTSTVTHDYHGVPDWLMKAYLTDLGGTDVPADEGIALVGAGWAAHIRKAPIRRIGSLAVGGARVEFRGDPAALDALFEQLHWKTLRGGG